MSFRRSLKIQKYQRQDFKDELAHEKQKAEKYGQQKYLWQQVAQELHEANQEQELLAN